MGIAGHLVSLAEEALQKEGIQKIFGLVFKDNETANAFCVQAIYPCNAIRIGLFQVLHRRS